MASTTTTGTTTAIIIVVEFDEELPGLEGLVPAEVGALAVEDDEDTGVEVEGLFQSVGMNWDWIAVGSTEFNVVRFTRLVGTGARNVDIPILVLEISQVDEFEHCQSSMPVPSKHGTLGSYTTSRSVLLELRQGFLVEKTDSSSGCTPQRCTSGRYTMPRSIVYNLRPLCFCRESSIDMCRQLRNRSRLCHSRTVEQVRLDSHDHQVVVRSNRTILRVWRWVEALSLQKPPVPCAWPQRVSERVEDKEKTRYRKW